MWDARTCSHARTVIADAPHDLFHGLDADFRGGARERVVPSRLSRTVPGVWIGAVPAVAMVLALSDHGVIDQRA